MNASDWNLSSYSSDDDHDMDFLSGQKLKPKKFPNDCFFSEFPNEFFQFPKFQVS